MELKTNVSRDDAHRMDLADPLASFRDRFEIPNPDRIYLDGNSLGRPAKATIERMTQLMSSWTVDLVEGWEEWIDVPERVGDLIGRELIGAVPGQVTMADGTTVNLYKLGSAVLEAQRPRNVIVTDDLNFPSDRYVAESLAPRFGGEVRWVAADSRTGPSRAAVAAALGDDVALVMLSHVDYRSGAICDVEGITRDAHEAGALVLLDLCHSVGVMPIELDQWGVDVAAGCTYKYLNSGPGSPAFLFVRAEHQNRLAQPIWGFFGAKDRFAMRERYEPEEGIISWLSTSPSIIAAVGVEAAVQVLAEAGIQRLREKSVALTSLALSLFEEWLVDEGFELDCPADANRRGSQVAFRHPEAGLISRALRERADVVGDFRKPDALRLGMAPIYTRYVDVWDGLDRLRKIVTEGLHLTLPEREMRVS